MGYTTPMRSPKPNRLPRNMHRAHSAVNLFLCPEMRADFAASILTKATRLESAVPNMASRSKTP